MAARPSDPAQVQHTVVFADADRGGNPCPVVFGADAWATRDMQAAAARLGHETAFVLEPRAGGDVRLRYFVPRHEMEMCVHATVAVTVLLGRRGALPAGAATIETPLGSRMATWDGAEGTAVIEQSRPRFGPPVTDVDAVAASLGLGVDRLDRRPGPIQSVSTARPKLMVPLVDEAAVDAIRLAAEPAWELCERLDVTGLYPFSASARGADAAARQFPLRAGYDEDPATGVAACALGAYLSTHRPPSGPGAPDGWGRWRIAQGRAMGRPSLIEAQARRTGDGGVDATRVGGRMEAVGEPEALPRP
jgi:PhzF family phenazine biosynthesis protein